MLSLSFFHSPTHTPTHTHAHTHTQTHTHARIRKHTHTHAYANTHAHIRMQTHSHSHSLTHIRTHTFYGGLWVVAVVPGILGGLHFGLGTGLGALIGGAIYDVSASVCCHSLLGRGPSRVHVLVGVILLALVALLVYSSRCSYLCAFVSARVLVRLRNMELGSHFGCLRSTRLLPWCSWVWLRLRGECGTDAALLLLLLPARARASCTPS